MDPTHSALVRGLLIGSAVVWAFFEVRQALQHRPEAVSADQGSRLAIRVGTVVAFVGAVLFRRALPSAAIKPEAFAAWAGLVFLWCGIALRLWSFQTLGRYFTFTVQTSEDQPVISAGPYRVIRHPGYAGILLASIGIGFLVGNWASLAIIFLGLLGALVYRIRVEEEALAGHLGGRYQDYAEGRKRLVPFIW